MAEIKAGTQVYDLDGYAYTYGGYVDGQHLVRERLRVGVDEWVDSDRLKSMAAVYTEPPQHVRAEEVARVQEQLDAAREELHTTRRELREIERTRAKLETQYAAVRQLDYLLNGEITHVVEIDGGTPKVHEIREYMRHRDRHGGGMQRLITLRAHIVHRTNDSPTGVVWRTHDDGYRLKGVAVMFARSLEDARAQAADYIASVFSAWRTDTAAVYHVDAAVKCAPDFGVEIPDDLAAAVRARRLENVKRLIRRREEDAQKTAKRLQDLRQELETLEES